ncbi:serine/threonine-protein kinase [Nocardia brevicatena]|uniref:serine/threonine-protein kinase n=1 Tax=Nocardia brevicatena TaxID=37327 RepID=UPI0009FCCF84|nr:serine/threonine-protein kinase [Nocardia brevicatena]
MNPQTRSGSAGRMEKAGRESAEAVSDRGTSDTSGSGRAAEDRAESEPTRRVTAGAEVDTKSYEPLRITEELGDMGLSEAQEIGRGGFGVVYRCVQKRLDRVVAVKVLSSDIDLESRERFLREEQAMGRLSGHPNIVDILQVDMTSGGLPFIVMPFCNRGSLEQVVHKLGPLSWADTLRAGVKLAGAIESAHRAHILHRDVKPGNVLISPYGEPQLTDFGIARVPGGFQTSSSLITGSPAFTAPEVLKGDDPTVCSDVYSLGSTLFALLTGHAAFERRAGEKVVAQFLRITTQPIPDLREQDIPADVAAVIERAMAQDPQDRPVSAYEFGEMLRTAQVNHGLVPDEMALLETEIIPTEAARTDRETSRTTGTLPAVTAPRSWPLYLHPSAPRPHNIAGTSLPGAAVATTLPPSPTTKFRPPTPSREPLARPRLLEVLRSGGRRRLAVVHAPAGFGKSTLAAQWRDELAAAGTAVAWIGIDSGDNNAVWFLAHLVEAIHQVRPDIGTGLGQVLEERPDDAVAYVVSTLVDELHTSGESVVVIIDDWHRITDEGARRVLCDLLDGGCHHLRFVVTGREQSDLPVSRMRVQDELVEVGLTQLRLTRDETEEILVRRQGCPLDDDRLDRLYTATEGWPAAVQLICLALRDNPDPERLLERLVEGGHGIRQYLAENVLDTLEPQMLEFLSDISVAEKVCASLATALSGASDAQQLLEQAEQRELFLHRVDDDPEWFRIQPLFAEHLRARLERTRPGRLKSLHRKASLWYAEHQLLRKSVDEALAATDLKMALDLLESGGMDLIDGSRLGTLLGSVSKLPVSQVASRSKLLMAVARANVNLQQSSAARSALGRLSNVLSRGSPDDGDTERQRCQASVLAAADDVFHDRLDGVLDKVSESLQHPDDLPAWTVSTAANVAAYVRLCEFDFAGARELEEWASPYHQRSKEPLAEIFALCGRGLLAFEQLDIETALRYYRQAYETAKARSGPRSHGARTAAGLLGELEYRRGDLEAAERLLDESYQLVARIGPIESLIATIVGGARVKAALGDPVAAGIRLDDGGRIADDHQLTRLGAYIRAEQIRLGQVGQDESTLRAANLGGQATVDTAPSGKASGAIAVLTTEALEIAAIRELLVTGGPDDLDRAVRRARALYGRTYEQQRPRAQLDMSLLLAECLAAAGWVGEAAALLASAVATCAEFHWTRPLLDSGPRVVEILRVLRGDLPLTAADGAETAGAVRTIGDVRLPVRFLDELLS